MPGKDRFLIKLICKNPACIDKIFELPRPLQPSAWFVEYSDAEGFIIGLQSATIPDPHSSKPKTLLDRELAKVALAASRTDFRDEIVSCACGYSARLSGCEFLIMRVPEGLPVSAIGD